MLQGLGDVLDEHGQDNQYDHHDNDNHQYRLAAQSLDRRKHCLFIDRLGAALINTTPDLRAQITAVKLGQKFDSHQHGSKPDQQEIDNHGSLQ